MLSAPPNSVPVSSREEAAPAFSTGAALRAMSASCAVATTTPQARTAQAVSSSQSEPVPVRVSST